MLNLEDNKKLLQLQDVSLVSLFAIDARRFAIDTRRFSSSSQCGTAIFLIEIAQGFFAVGQFAVRKKSLT